jgi:hypothetical protein
MTTTTSPDRSSTTATEDPTPTPTPIEPQPEAPSCETGPPQDTPTPEALGQLTGKITPVVPSASQLYRIEELSPHSMQWLPYYCCLETMVRVLYRKVSPEMLGGNEATHMEPKECLEGLGVSLDPKACNSAARLQGAYNLLHGALADAELLEVCGFEIRLVLAAELMRAWPVHFDPDRLSKLKALLNIRLTISRNEIRLTLGIPDIDPDSEDQIVSALQRAGIKVESTQEKELVKFQHPALDCIANYRHLSATLLATEHYLSNSITRTRTEWGTWGSSTGQTVCTDPLFQGMFEDPGLYACLVCPRSYWHVRAKNVDAEVRVMAFASDDDRMVEALQPGCDFHRLTMAALKMVSPDSITEEDRLICKTLMKGISSGLDPNALAFKLRRTTKEGYTPDLAKQWLDALLHHYPKLGAWLHELREKARTATEVRTLKLRRRVLLPSGPEYEEFRYKQLVKQTIEGTVADATNVAVVQFARGGGGAYLITNYNGELTLDISITPNEFERDLVGVMRTALAAMIPGVPVETISEIIG